MQGKISFTPQTENSFIQRSKELIHMSAYERLKFLSDHKDVSKKEKARVIDTFIAILEKTEDYESCESLFQLKKALIGRPSKE